MPHILPKGIPYPEIEAFPMKCATLSSGISFRYLNNNLPILGSYYLKCSLDVECLTVLDPLDDRAMELCVLGFREHNRAEEEDFDFFVFDEVPLEFDEEEVELLEVLE